MNVPPHQTYIDSPDILARESETDASLEHSSPVIFGPTPSPKRNAAVATGDKAKRATSTSRRDLLSSFTNKSHRTSTPTGDNSTPWSEVEEDSTDLERDPKWVIELRCALIKIRVHVNVCYIYVHRSTMPTTEMRCM